MTEYSLIAGALVGNSLTLSGNLIILSPIKSRVPPTLRDRKPITTFSASSSHRMTKYLRECASDYTTMITLTYSSSTGFDGERCKYDLARFNQQLRRSEYWHTGASVFWFLEFQSRGSIHFHLLTTIPFIPHSYIAKLWNDIVFYERKKDMPNKAFKASGSDTRVLSESCESRRLNWVLGNLEQQYQDRLDTDYQREKASHLAAGTRVERIKSGRDGTISYARKYAAKQSQKDVPIGFGWCGRFWGICGNRTRDKVAKVAISNAIPVDAVPLFVELNDAVDTLDLVFMDDYCCVLRLPSWGVVGWYKERIMALAYLLGQHHAIDTT